MSIIGVELFFSYLVWHYFECSKEILKVIRNFLRFGFHYFSIPFLFQTFFSYWRKYFWLYPRGFDFGKYFEVFLSNLISRVIGAVLRTFLILAGIVFEISVLIIGASLILGWFFLPLFLFYCLVYGVKLLF